MARKPAGKQPVKGAAKGGSASRGQYTASDNSAEYLEYFGKQYGERWPALLQSLLQPIKHVALENPHVVDVADVSLPSSELMISCRGCKCYMWVAQCSACYAAGRCSGGRAARRRDNAHTQREWRGSWR